MNARAIYAIIRKDLKVISQNKGVVIPSLIMPFVMFVLSPWAVALLLYLVKLTGIEVSNDVKWLIDLMGAGFQQEFAGYDNNQKLIIYFLVYMMAPLFLMVPLMLSTMISADSFAGEKERKTMEALLYTPTSDRDLFFAKLLSSWLPVTAVAFAGFVLYAIMVNAAAWPQMQRIFFPNAMWLILIFWVVPAVPGLGIGAMVYVSSRAEGFQDATQTGSLVIMPALLLLIGQISGAMSFSITVMFLIGLVFWILDGLLIWFGSRTFRRGRLMGA